MDEPFYNELAWIIYRIFSVLFLVIGTSTNILSILVYSKKHMRKTSYSLYLLELAIVDLFVIMIGNARYAIISYFGIDIRETSLVLCKIHKFLTYFSLQLSSCLLSMLSIDRFFGVVLALKAFTFNKKSLSHRVSIILIVLLIFVNIHILVWYGYKVETNESNLIVCEIHSNKLIYSKFWEIYFYLDSIIYCILPFIIMTTCNAFIITRTIKSRIQSQAILRTSAKIITSSRRTVGTTNKNLKKTFPKSISSGSISANEQRILILLLVMSLGFFIFTTPISIIEFLDNFNQKFQKIPSKKLLNAIGEMFMYLNHVVNFFFYFFIGPNFRKEIAKLFRRRFCLIRKNKNIKSSKFSRYNTIFAASSFPIFSRRYGIGGGSTNGNLLEQNAKITINIYENDRNDDNLNNNPNSFRLITKKIADHITILYKIDSESNSSSNLKRTNTCQTNISNQASYV
jgi:hypothetical protein